MLPRAFILAVALSVPTAVHGQPAQPNIVLVLVDDLDTAAMATLPGLREVTTEAGLSFSRGYIPNSLCGPSRGALMTGTNSHSNGYLFNGKRHYREWKAQGWEDQTFPIALQGAGYHTIHVGKPVNGWPDRGPLYTPPGWNVYSASMPRVGGYMDFSEYVDDGSGGIVNDYSGPDSYRTDVEAGIAVGALRAAADLDQPVFLYLSLYTPHAESGTEPTRAIPAPRHEGTLPDAIVPRDPDFDEDDVSDKHADLAGRTPLPGYDGMDGLFRSRVEAMLSAEEAIRDLRDELEALGMADDTYVFFVSDNGIMLGHHRIRGSKGYPYERSARVPFAVSGPGISAGTLDDALVSIVDLAPTFLDLAGAPAPAHYEGRSLVPLLTGEPVAWRQTLLLEGWNRDTLPYYRTVITAEGLKYTEFPRSGEVELYDLVADPFELDGSWDFIPQADLDQFSFRLGQLAGCSRAACASIDGRREPKTRAIRGRLEAPAAIGVPLVAEWKSVGLRVNVRLVLDIPATGESVVIASAPATDGRIEVSVPDSLLGQTVQVVLRTAIAEWAADPVELADVRAHTVVDGTAGALLFGPPAPGLTVADLAAQNLVTGVPGYFPNAGPSVWTGFDTGAGQWVPAASADQVLPLGRAFRWRLRDEDGVGRERVSISRAFPFDLRSTRRPNTADIAVELDTSGTRWNVLANPFDAPLDLTRMAEWPGAVHASGATAFDNATRRWVAIDEVAPWQAFRVRARGPRPNGGPRILTIPAWAAGLAEPPPPPPEATAPPGALARAAIAPEVALEAPIPNPSAGRAEIRFALAERGPIRLAVYDVRGREVAVVADGDWPAGAHRARLAEGLAGGVYVVRLEAGGRVLTHRAVVVR
ncbi:sulfatase-like hydrolase/transferase [Rubrivirga sp. IMCC45206]|uniref:sulfatase-like hydrolase/transferase n=1 Tax=Rubrivirga sp. IMCC45206 TaxID=3391614 RepID=UPI0039900A85